MWKGGGIIIVIVDEYVLIFCSSPAPLYYNQDSIPDLLIRSNIGEWNYYNISTMRLLDGVDGKEIWSLDSAHTGMMSGLSIASNSTGFDAMLFMTVGMLDSSSDRSRSDSRRKHRVRRHESHNNDGDVDIGIPEEVEGEAEVFEDDHHDESTGN